MLGDELKKALEPIQASDELLEKTRKAIEQARLEQARQTITEKPPEKTVRSGARRSFYLKALVPVACALILIAGVVFLLPTLNKGRDASKSGDRGKKGMIQEHNAAVNEVVDQIDGYLGGDEDEHMEYIAENTQAASETWESTTDAADNDSKYQGDSKDAAAEATTTEAENDIDMFYKNKSISFSSNMTDRLSVTASVSVGKFDLSISSDGKELILSDHATGKTVESNDEHEVPNIKDCLHVGETMTGLLYDEDYYLLYISTVEKSQDENKEDSVHLFCSGYADGKVTKDPERVG